MRKYSSTICEPEYDDPSWNQPHHGCRDGHARHENAERHRKARAAEARAAGIASPLLDLASQLYGETVSLGNSRQDMISVLQAIEARTDNAHPHPTKAADADRCQTTDSPSDSACGWASTGHLS